MAAMHGLIGQKCINLHLKFQSIKILNIIFPLAQNNSFQREASRAICGIGRRINILSERLDHGIRTEPNKFDTIDMVPLE